MTIKERKAVHQCACMGKKKQDLTGVWAISILLLVGLIWVIALYVTGL